MASTVWEICFFFFLNVIYACVLFTIENEIKLREKNKSVTNFVGVVVGKIMFYSLLALRPHRSV